MVARTQFMYNTLRVSLKKQVCKIQLLHLLNHEFGNYHLVHMLYELFGQAPCKPECSCTQPLLNQKNAVEQKQKQNLLLIRRVKDKVFLHLIMGIIIIVPTYRTA